MSKNANTDRVPIPVSSIDPPALLQLAKIYDGILQDGVRGVAGDNVPEVIEKSQDLAVQIEKNIGSVASSETIGITVVEVSQYERYLIESARRVYPEEAS